VRLEIWICDWRFRGLDADRRTASRVWGFGSEVRNPKIEDPRLEI